MEYTVGMAEAKSKLAELVGQAKYGGNRYILERRGQPMAVLIGMEEYAQLQAAAGVGNPQSPLPLALQRRQAVLIARAQTLCDQLGDPVVGLTRLFSTLPPEDADFWLEIEEAR